MCECDVFFVVFKRKKFYCKLKLQCYTMYIQQNSDAYFYFHAQYFFALFRSLSNGIAIPSVQSNSITSVVWFVQIRLNKMTGSYVVYSSYVFPVISHKIQGFITEQRVLHETKGAPLRWQMLFNPMSTSARSMMQ